MYYFDKCKKGLHLLLIPRCLAHWFTILINYKSHKNFLGCEFLVKKASHSIYLQKFHDLDGIDSLH